MYVRVLGPVAAGSRAAEVIPVTGQISAAVLAQLVLAEGRWLSADALIDAVWDDPPTSARNAIQVAVSKLRKQFGAELVLSRSHGYALDTSQVTSDWRVAAQLIADARRALDSGDAVAAAEAAAEAVSLFRGEPLLGLSSRAADAARHEAEERRAAARQITARALLAQQRPDEAVAAIQPSCDAHPLDEPTHLLRVEALAATGRLAAALASYDQFRRTLADELGVDPSPAARALFARLLRAGHEPVGDSSTSTQPTAPGSRHQLTLGLAPSRATAHQTRAVQDRLPTSGTVVLTGPSGVGKTQVAAGVFADSACQLRIWVSAGSTSSIVAAYADAADMVQKVDSSRPEKDRARQFLAWLASTPESWLVVLDDVTDAADVRGWWPPQSQRRGLVIATTQRRVAELSGEGRDVVDVGLYSAEESLAYLQQRLPTAGDASDEELGRLAETLGHHPLALGVAAAVILDEASSVELYRQRLTTSPLSASLPGDVRADGYPRSLQAAWGIALQRADQQTQAAASRLLEVLSVLDPVGAPQAVLDTRAVQRHLDSRTATSGREILLVDSDPPPARTVLRALHQVSLTDHDPRSEPRSIRTHALTGRLARERATESELVAALRTAAQALVESWPEFPTSKIAETLRSNATTVEELDAAIDRRALWSDPGGGLPPLAALHGRSLMDAEQFAVALPYLEGLLRECVSRLGPRHLDTITLHGDIARARSLSGDPGRARAELTALLDDLRGSLGADHPGTLITAKTLADIGLEAGSPRSAAQEIEAILPQLERVLGLDHEVTLSALQDLANAYGESADDRTISLYDDLIERCRSRVGDDHRRTVILKADRAYWLGHLGDQAASESAMAALLPQLERVLGPLDPNTLRARNNRAYFLTDHAAAYDQFSRLLAVRLEVLGPDHSDTLATRGNLANRRGMLGDAAGAAEDFAAVIADQQRALGPENRFVLLCRGYQARWLIEAGQLEDGAELGRQALTDLHRVLGSDHPFSLRIKALLDDLGVS